VLLLTPFVYGLAKSVVISSSLIPGLDWWSGNSPRWYSQYLLIGVGSGFSGASISESQPFGLIANAHPSLIDCASDHTTVS